MALKFAVLMLSIACMTLMVSEAAKVQQEEEEEEAKGGGGPCEEYVYKVYWFTSEYTTTK